MDCIAFLQSSSDSSGLFLTLIWMLPQPSSLSSYSTVKRRLRRSKTRRCVDWLKSNVKPWVRFQVPNAAIFSLNKEDHTVGNLIRHQLMKGYSERTPTAKSVLSLKFRKKTVNIGGKYIKWHNYLQELTGYSINNIWSQNWKVRTTHKNTHTQCTVYTSCTQYCT